MCVVWKHALKTNWFWSGNKCSTISVLYGPLERFLKDEKFSYCVLLVESYQRSKTKNFDLESRCNVWRNITSKLTQRVPKTEVCLKGIDLYMKMGIFFHVDIIKILIANLNLSLFCINTLWFVRCKWNSVWICSEFYCWEFLLVIFCGRYTNQDAKNCFLKKNSFR